jgi:hypothetical protein
VGSNPTRATWKIGPSTGGAKEVTEQGLVQSAGPNVQLASTSLQGRPVRRWRRGHALAGAPMGNSWLRGRLDGNVSVSGCGKPIPPSTSVFGGVAQLRESARLSGERSPVRVRSSPLRLHGGRGVSGEHPRL